MTNTYTELLEQIISEMKTSLLGGKSTVVDSEYRQWLDFLRQVHPESELLKEESIKPSLPPSQSPPEDGLPVYADLREIVRLAASFSHPTWYILPHFFGSTAQFVYENGELQNALGINGVPQTIDKFSGTIYGVWLTDQIFIACDVSSKDNFAKRMEFLKTTGFSIPDFALFPTDKLLTISVSKLETSLIHFISTAREKWAKVDGAIIVSDTPILGESNKILFKPSNLSLAL